MPRAVTTKRVTLSSVARRCKVSPATVSRILNGDDTFSTTRRTRELVLSTARAMNYRPDLRAQNLRGRSTGLVGVFSGLEPGIGGIYGEIVTGIARALEGRYIAMYGLNLGDGQTLSSFPWKLSGAVMLQGVSGTFVDGLRESGVPFVAVNERVTGAAASVLPDERGGMEMALAHLTRLGHRRIAYLGAHHSSHFSVKERFALFERLAGAKAVDARRHVAPKSVRTALQHAVATRKATAVVSYNYQTTVSVLRAAGQMSLRIPQDVSLLTFDSVYPLQDIHPSVTATSLDYEGMGARAVGRLLGRIDAAPRSTGATGATDLVPYRLVAGESTASVGGDAAPRARAWRLREDGA